MPRTGLRRRHVPANAPAMSEAKLSARFSVRPIFRDPPILSPLLATSLTLGFPEVAPEGARIFAVLELFRSGGKLGAVLAAFRSGDR